jgi:RHS repeat-associated protein
LQKQEKPLHIANTVHAQKSVAIMDENGNTVVRYGYDAWGAPLWCTGELAETLGKVQPFRYRGYVFDEETGLYYICNRYYNSKTSMFLTADNSCILTETNHSLYEKNLYAYCDNNPVSRDDQGEIFGGGLLVQL